MAKVCEICGKGPRTGSTITRKGLQKKKGGIGLHITGVTRRRFLPNIQRVRVTESGRTLHRRVCASCIKSGKIVKV
jgi:large subunit ribosomal protein L28